MIALKEEVHQVTNTPNTPSQKYTNHQIQSRLCESNLLLHQLLCSKLHQFVPILPPDLSPPQPPSGKWRHHIYFLNSKYQILFQIPNLFVKRPNSFFQIPNTPDLWPPPQNPDPVTNSDATYFHNSKFTVYQIYSSIYFHNSKYTLPNTK